MKKKVIIGIGVVLLIVVIVFLNLVSRKEKKSVETEVIRAKSITETVKAEGYLEAFNQVEIGSDVMGRIERILVEKGDRVKKGDLLIIINPETYRARRDQIFSQLQADLARLEVLKQEFNRAQEIFDQGLISESEYEKTRSDFLSVKAQVKSDSSSLRAAQEELRKCYIRSPVSGEVFEIYKKEGEMVVIGTINTPGSVILVIGDRNRMIVKGEVDETEIPRIKPGNRAIISIDAFMNQKFEGKVLRVGGLPQQEVGGQGTVSFPIDVLLTENNTGFRPGMSATVEIITNSKDSVPAIPYTALGKKRIKDSTEYFIFLLKQGEAKRTTVKLGIEGKEDVEVQGVEIGDTLIKGPQKILKDLKDGELVEVKKPRPEKRKFKREKDD